MKRIQTYVEDATAKRLADLAKSTKRTVSSELALALENHLAAQAVANHLAAKAPKAPARKSAR